MQLVVPASGEIAPGVHLEIGAPMPLPSDRDAWRERTLGDAVIVELQTLVTEAGWTATTIVAREARAAARRTLYAFYELFDSGVVVTIRARDAASLGGARERIFELLRAADIDREHREVVALAQVWEEA
jgi:hypothetical protein